MPASTLGGQLRRAAGGELELVELPPEAGVRAPYAIAALRDAAAPRQARDFVAFVLSAAGQQILREHGFESPG